MKLIENYLDSLSSYLPEELNEEVRAELESSIYDQIEELENQHGEPVSEHKQVAILKNIGHPMQVASKFMPNQFLISQEAFPAYKRILFLALYFYSALILILHIPVFMSGSSLVLGMSLALYKVFFSCLTVFSVVTLAFYALERNHVNLDFLYAWSPRNLPKSGKKLGMSRIETGFEMVIEIVFLAWWNNGVIFSKVLNTEIFGTTIELSPEWDSVFWLINGVVATSILLNAYKLAKVGWNRKSLYANAAVNSFLLILLMYILSFDSQVVFTSLDGSIPKIEILAKVLNYSVISIILVILITSIYELIQTLRKLKRL